MRFSGKGYLKYPSLFFGQSDFQEHFDILACFKFILYNVTSKSMLGVFCLQNRDVISNMIQLTWQTF